MNWRGFERKGSWLNFKVLSRHSPGGTEEIYENLSQDNQSLGRDLNPGSPEYEERVLTTGPRRSVWVVFFVTIEAVAVITCVRMSVVFIYSLFNDAFSVTKTIYR
jgi:hypothetical protein